MHDAVRQLRVASEAARKKPVAPTDDELALAFTDRHGDDLRYVAVWGAWFHWNGNAWEREETLKAYDLARALTREIPGASRSAKTVAATENLARSDRRHAMKDDAFDLDTWIFNEGGP